MVFANCAFGFSMSHAKWQYLHPNGALYLNTYDQIRFTEFPNRNSEKVWENWTRNNGSISPHIRKYPGSGSMPHDYSSWNVSDLNLSADFAWCGRERTAWRHWDWRDFAPSASALLSADRDHKIVWYPGQNTLLPMKSANRSWNLGIHNFQLISLCQQEECKNVIERFSIDVALSSLMNATWLQGSRTLCWHNAKDGWFWDSHSASWSVIQIW
jgi:hypothetical protein